MKRLVLFMLLVSVFLCLVSAQDRQVPGIKFPDISEFSGDNGRVIKPLDCPGIGDELYRANVNYSHLSRPVLWLAGELPDREIIVEIIALNLEQGLQKPHLIRILPGESFQLRLDSLGDIYGTLHLFSMSPYAACLIDPDTGEKHWVDRIDSIYNPPGNAADELNRPLYDPINPPIHLPPIGLGGPGLGEDHLQCNLMPRWTLVCATPSLCGDYHRTGYGTVWLTNPNDPYYSHYFNINWGAHYPCGNLATKTSNQADPGYPDCVTTWILTYGNCPLTATNCRGEIYTVYRSL